MSKAGPEHVAGQPRYPIPSISPVGQASAPAILREVMTVVIIDLEDELGAIAKGTSPIPGVSLLKHRYM